MECRGDGAEVEGEGWAEGEVLYLCGSLHLDLGKKQGMQMDHTIHTHYKKLRSA